MQGGFPTFRTTLDSLVSNITFALPAHPGKVTQITYSSVNPLNSSSTRWPKRRDGFNVVRYGKRERPMVTNLRSGFPFAFLGFEANPETLMKPRYPLDRKMILPGL